MKNNNVNVLHILSFLIIILSVVATATGLFYTTGGAPFDIINQYGDSVKMYGDGIYAHDSFFRVPIFKGTDLTILLVGVPMLAAATLLDLKKEEMNFGTIYKPLRQQPLYTLRIFQLEVI